MLILPIANQSQSTSTYSTYNFSVQTNLQYRHTWSLPFFFPLWSNPTPLPALSFYQSAGDDGWYSCNGKFRIALFDWSSCIFISSKDKRAEFGRLINKSFSLPPSASGENSVTAKAGQRYLGSKWTALCVYVQVGEHRDLSVCGQPKFTS